MVGMQSQFGRGRYVDTISNRGLASGGSVGGNKKSGSVQYGPSWPRGNMGNFLRRAPQGCCPRSIAFNLYNTTRNPLQYSRNGYAVSHSGRLG